MPRRKKKKKTDPPPAPKPVPGPLGHNPFQALKNLEIKDQNVPDDVEAPPETLPAPDDDDLFRSAMADVDPIVAKKKRIAIKRDRAREPVFYSEDLEILAQLQDLVDGRAQFDLLDTDEYIEGFIRGAHPVILEKLRRGRFSVQAYLDLHGLTLREAGEAVRDFIQEASTLGYRCVLLVHGRGLNSKDQIPVLKKKLESLLLRGPVRKQILAFTSARPHDGGAGASYVLLRAMKK